MISKQFDEELDIKDPESARTFLLFYLFETWEKLVQIAAFVDSREHRRSRRKRAIITNFSDVLGHLAKELDGSAVTYYQRLEAGETFVFQNFVEAVIATKHVLEALQGIHQKLNLLTGRSENQITYDFVRKLAADSTGKLSQEQSWLPHVPSIALTDMYEFIEYDLRNILSAELQDYDFAPLPPQGREIVLALPKAEADNPLMWAILAHETAHAMISNYKILEEILTRTPGYGKADDDSRKVYRNWSLEICADLIALRLLGPSYFFSFASMGLLLDPSPLTEGHPAIINRIGIMEKILTEKCPQWVVKHPDTSRVTFTQQDLIPFFLYLSRYKHELWTLPEYRMEFWSRDYPMVDTRLEPDRDLISEVLDRVHVPIAEFASPEQIGDSLRILSSGQPVSSQGVEFDKDKFRSALHAVKTAEDFYALLPPPEKPLTLSSILACGWMLKVYFNYADLLGEVTTAGSLSYTAESYKKTLAKRNELLQNSLSRAFMMQMYWRWRDVIGGKNHGH